ncbi:YbgC/FadM family acyl-CoA thioesterase [Caenimonas koreensis]|uniref:YbgC/FadM family acyl-CoA thioesterase n=1 Tax=Caenimonas koreensis DSM 17982 TaxID=1121255 RepID=A0A844BH59_9BURK|nr:YbgC/FadM family acyl-CoA thioesterase [Caenimonas koreensis]MRD49771.1 YbgC/FadM family acyl-CoA thioesterase [Caenimonas koreensis DSM 17982]
MKRQDFRFFHRLRVRWAEVDMQKIVFNAHYLMYVDTAVADYWRALAMPYEEAMHLLDGDIYARKATVEFNASARMDERLDVGVKCTRIGTSSMNFTGAIFRDNDLLVTVELVYVFADPATQTSRPVPQALRELLLGFEAGEDMLNVVTGDWARLGADAQRIRSDVFIEEQRIPAELEWDEDDKTALHVVIYNRLGQTLATGRLLQHAPGVAKIGRVAVHRVLRGSRVGARVMATLMEAARARGDHEVILNAQRSAEPFYLGLGFAPRGDAFDEAGIAHIEMVRPLAPA